MNTIHFGRRGWILMVLSGFYFAQTLSTRTESSGVLSLELRGMTNGTVSLLLLETEPGVQYEIYSAESLDNTIWVLETTVSGAFGTNATPATFAFQDQTDSRFVTSRSVPVGQLPGWWQLQHFGCLDVDPNADPDADGLINIEEYLLGSDPTVDDLPGGGIGGIEMHTPLE